MARRRGRNGRPYNGEPDVGSRKNPSRPNDGGRELLSPLAAVLWIVGVALVITLAIIYW